MPAPDVYEKGVVDPFTDTHPIEKIPYKGILYVTDRAPASTDNHFYKNKRGNLLRLGAAKIQIGKEGITWEEARRISLLKNRTDKYPIKVTGAEISHKSDRRRRIRHSGPQLFGFDGSGFNGNVSASAGGTFCPIGK